MYSFAWMTGRDTQISPKEMTAKFPKESRMFFQSASNLSLVVGTVRMSSKIIRVIGTITTARGYRTLLARDTNECTQREP